jgi:hypothetical protein
MPTIAATTLLRNEILLALATAPASTYVVPYKASNLDLTEDYDPQASLTKRLCIVFMPIEIDANPLTESLNVVSHSVKIHITNPRDNAAGTDPGLADEDMAAVKSAIKTSLRTYTSNNMKKLGFCEGAPRIRDVGWIERGQDQRFEIGLTYIGPLPSTSEITIP